METGSDDNPDRSDVKPFVARIGLGSVDTPDRSDSRTSVERVGVGSDDNEGRSNPKSSVGRVGVERTGDVDGVVERSTSVVAIDTPLGIWVGISKDNPDNSVVGS